jgi:hypothetical protein
MVDEALRALVARHRSAEVEASYRAYDEHPSTNRTTGVIWRRSAKPPDGRDHAARAR